MEAADTILGHANAKLESISEYDRQLFMLEKLSVISGVPVGVWNTTLGLANVGFQGQYLGKGFL